MTDDDVASLTDHYRGRMGSLLAVDDLVGDIEKALKKTGEARDTVVIFTSDNGWILGEHRLHDSVTENGSAAGVKYVPYDGSARVPLMIAGPGFPRGLKVESPTVNADLAPRSPASAVPRRAAPGRALAAADRPSSEDFRDRAVLIETAKNPRGVPPYVSIRTERYRYDVTADGFPASTTTSATRGSYRASTTIRATPRSDRRSPMPSRCCAIARAPVAATRR